MELKRYLKQVALYRRVKAW